MATVSEHPPLTSKFWTYEEYCRLDDDRRYEIDDGELIPMLPPSPDFSHQSGLGNLNDVFRRFVLPKKLGVVIFAPFDVVFDDRNLVQPDLIYVARERHSIIQPGRIYGPPDLVVEVVSPGSKARDRQAKKQIYARFGVKEYWLVDPANDSLQVLTLEGDAYVEHASATGKGHVTSRVLAGLKVKVSDVF